MNNGSHLFKAVMILSIFLSAQARAAAVKHFAPASKGCIPTVSLDQARGVMARFNVTTKNATVEEERALGTGLVWIEKLNDGAPIQSAIWRGRQPYPFQFNNSFGYSRQTGGGIHIARHGNREFGRNVAQLVHELGHLVGNMGVYAEYRKAVNNRYCVVSGYSDDRANEQFAEVFAAFVTHPSLIRDNKSAACQAAYKFFKEKLFAKGELADKCATKTLKAGEDY